MRSTARHIVAVVVAIVLTAAPAFAAISLDAVSTSDTIAAVGTTLTFPATVSGNYLAVCVTVRDATIVSVTWNGTPITAQVTANDSGGTGVIAAIYDVNSPDTGTHDVVIVASAVPTYLAGTAISLDGVATSSHVDDTDTAIGADPSFAALTTTVDADAVIDCLGSNDPAPGAASMNAESGRVERARYGADAQERTVGASTILAKAPAGSVTMGWVVAGNTGVIAGLAVKPILDVLFDGVGLLGVIR